MAFPGLLIALLIVSALGGGLTNVMLALAIYILPRFTRVSRGASQTIKQNLYIDAARAMGGSDFHIISRHILPNATPLFVTQVALEMATVVLMASGLSFLGLSAQRPTPELGLMLNDGRQYLQSAPHVVLVPGVAIMLLILSVNLFADLIYSLMNPRDVVTIT